MRFNTRLVLKDYKGEEIIQYVEKGATKFEIPLTFQEAIINILNGSLQNEIQTAEEKTQSYIISRKVYESDEVNLTPKEIAFIQERSDKVANSLVRGILYDMFENPSKETTNPQTG